MVCHTMSIMVSDTLCQYCATLWEGGDREKGCSEERRDMGGKYHKFCFCPKVLKHVIACLKSLVKIILHFNLTSNKFLLLDWDQTQCHLKKIKWKFREGKDNLKVWHWRQTSAFSPDNIVLFHYFQSIHQVTIWPSLSWSKLYN